MLLVLLTAGAGPAQAAAVTSALSGVWTSTNTWSPARVPASTDTVTIANGHTVTLQDALPHDAAALTIQTGGTLTHASNTTTAAGEPCKVVLSIAGNLTLDAGGQINVDGKGYSAGNGPGRPGGTARAGGSHGGKGGIDAQMPAGSGPTYGSITAPTNLGSASGGAGGGAIILTVAGTSTVNGTISAQGTTLNYGSAGGSVFLTTGALIGSGLIRANGGPSVGQYCSGGGGRIAVILTRSMSFGNVQLQAYTSSGLANWPGAGGTLYLQHTNHVPDQGKLIVDYNDLIPVSSDSFGTNARAVCVTLQNGTAPSSYTFSEIVLTNGGVYALDTNDTLTIASPATIRGDPADRNDGLYLLGGTLNSLSPFTAYSNYFLGVGLAASTLTPTPASLTVGTNAGLKIDAPFTLPFPLILGPGGLLDHTPNIAAEAYKVDLTIQGDLTVHPGGLISADDAGYRATYGPGKGLGQRWGAGHGGAGGYNLVANTNGAPYGSITAPTNIGSGGPGGWGSGGGAIKLSVTGTTTVNGTITASATNSGAGGSGGSVFLTTGALTGSGAIKAGSIPGAWQYGGGGRIAVILTNGNAFGAIAFQAWPGIPSVGNGYGGGAGTVYLQTRTQGAGRGTLILDATNRVNANATCINSLVTDTVVGTVLITNGAILLIESNQSLTVNGNWLNASKPVNASTTNWAVSFTSAPNSTVMLASTNAAVMAGASTFHNLACTTAGKTVRFTAGTTNVVTGQLTLGSAPAPGQGGVSLLSTADGAYWYLTLAAGGTQQPGAVTVKDSQAGGGQTLRAGYGSINLGHNGNWAFPADGTTIIMR